MSPTHKMQLWYQDMFLYEFEACSWDIKSSKNYIKFQGYPYQDYAGYPSNHARMYSWQMHEKVCPNLCICLLDCHAYNTLHDNLTNCFYQEQKVDLILNEEVMFTNIIFQDRYINTLENKFDKFYRLSYTFMYRCKI